MDAYLQNILTLISSIKRVFIADLYIIDNKTEYINLYITRQEDFILHRES